MSDQPSDQPDSPDDPKAEIGEVHGRRLSSVQKRTAGRLIDWVIMAGLAAVLGWIGIGVFIEAVEFWRGAVTVAAFFVWEVVFVAVLGATPGKLLLGMRVIDAETGVTPPGLSVAAKRNAHRPLSLVPGIGQALNGLIGLISAERMEKDPEERRSVMDRVANTRVVDI